MSTARRFHRLPPAKYLTPKILELDAEAAELETRRRAALDERERLAHPDQDEAAAASDRAAMAAAVRAGKSAHSVGTPATEQLVKDRAAADAEISALAEAVRCADRDITAEFNALAADPKRSGLADATAARVKYGKAIQALAGARRDFYAAAALAAFIRAAGDTATAEQDATAPRAEDGWPTTRPAWLRAVEVATRAAELTWRDDTSPPVSFARYTNHLGIRASDARLAAQHAVDLFAAEIEEQTTP